MAEYYRTGRKVGRTIYHVAEDGTEALVGLMDTTELAGVFVDAVNRQRASAPLVVAPQPDGIRTEWIGRFTNPSGQHVYERDLIADDRESAEESVRYFADRESVLMCRWVRSYADGSEWFGPWVEPESSRERSPCPTCSGPIRETVGMVCQSCGTDYREEGVPT